LFDNEDQSQYSAHFDASNSLNSKEIIYNDNNEFFGVYDDANPNLPKKTYLVFEVPNDVNISNGTLLSLNDGSSETRGFNLK
jgi:hypothetical protein